MYNKLLLIAALFVLQNLSSQIKPPTGVTPQAGTNPPPGTYNVIKFTYDNVGNQTKRSMIYVANKQGSTVLNDTITTASNITNDFTESQYAGISYYPNPVKSELYIKWTNSVDYEVQNIQLYDINGKLINDLKNQRSNETAVINFENLPVGYYTVVLIYTSGNKKELKIVKQ